MIDVFAKAICNLISNFNFDDFKRMEQDLIERIGSVKSLDDKYDIVRAFSFFIYASARHRTLSYIEYGVLLGDLAKLIEVSAESECVDGQ